jgi:hypothetical protein
MKGHPTKRDVDAYTNTQQPQIKGISFGEPAVARKHINGDQHPSIPSFKITSINHPHPLKPFNTNTTTSNNQNTESALLPSPATIFET